MENVEKNSQNILRYAKYINTFKYDVLWHLKDE